MQLPILNGVYTDTGTDFRVSYPVNMVPVPKDTGISGGYLRPSEGINIYATGPGTGRGGINWDGTHYRVMGTKLVAVSATGVVTTLGDVGGSSGVRLDYSPDRLAIASDNRLYYWDKTNLVQVTDGDLGNVLDVIFVDGYFMTTDGTFLVITELADPTAVDPLKYGSSEIDPDPIVGVEKIRNEPYAVNRYTVEVFRNVGGSGFPFQRIEGARINKGALSASTKCVMDDTLAFIGSGRNESISVYLASNSSAARIATQEIDDVLSTFSESRLAGSKVETRFDRGHQFLYLHLPDRTLVFDSTASKLTGTQVWFTLTSAQSGFSRYRAQNFVRVHDAWYCEDPTTSAIGVLTNDTGHHYGAKVRWEFGTKIIYGESRGALFNSLELVALTGRVALGDNPMIGTSYSVDGSTWSQEHLIRSGKIGQRDKRLVWRGQGHMLHWRVQRFRGDSDSHLTVARLEADIEPLAA